MNVAQEAESLVEGHRQADYGHPAIDLGRTALLVTALLDGLTIGFGEGQYRLKAEDMSQIQRMVKESRLRNSPRHRDSLVDICGYALTQEMVWSSEDDR